MAFWPKCVFYKSFKKIHSHFFDFFSDFQKSQSHDFDFFGFFKKVKSWLWLDLTWWLAAQVCSRLFNNRDINLENPSRDEKISAQTIGSFDLDRIRRLEIKDLEIYKRSRDFANSRFIFNLETFCIFKISFYQIEMGKSRDFKISKLNLEI